MDFNIAAAFWFASRGTGWLYQPQNPQRLGTLDGGDTGEDTATVHSPTARARADREVDITPPATIVVKTATANGAVESSAEHARSSTVIENPAQEIVGSRVARMKATKVNKNMDELCPVDGCRRLLKAGCVFNVCSRCCLKVQGILDVDGACPAKSVSTTEASRLATSVAANTDGPQERQERFKADAAKQAIRALENHLTTHFEELSAPLQAEALASLLRGDDSACRVRAGRDVHRRSSASTSAVQQAIKWCPVHKSLSKMREFAANRGGGGSSEDRSVTEGGKQLAPKMGGTPSTATLYTSAARVLLVRECLDSNTAAMLFRDAAQ